MGKSSFETTNLDLIIEKIRSDGIEAGEAESLRIKDEARAEAENIISRARKEAETMLADAEKAISHKEHTSRKALEFAARDSVLMIRSYLENIFKKLVSNECTRVIDKNLLKEMILKILDKWSESGVMDEIKIQISDEDSKNIRDILYASISDRMGSSLDIKPVAELKAGFRISKTGEHFYHDFSDESIAELLFFFLSEEVKELLDPASKEQ